MLFNPGVFAMIRTLSETVVLPVAGLLLTFVMTWELIQLIIDQNNLHSIDTWIFFKWVFKTMIAVFILTHTFTIVTVIFDVSQYAIFNSVGVINNETAITIDTFGAFAAHLETMSVGALTGLFLQSFLMRIVIMAINIVIFIIVYGRMIEIYLLTSLAPIPLATLTNSQMSGMGQNYLKSLLAVSFQGLLMLVCVAIYAALVQNIAIGGDPVGAIWSVIGYTVLLCFTLFKMGSVSKSTFGAH